MDEIKYVYIIDVTSWSCDIYSEGGADLRQAFLSKEDAETFILESGLIDKLREEDGAYYEIRPVPIKTYKKTQI